MEELKIKVEGNNAVFEDVKALYRARQAEPQAFHYGAGGVLMLTIADGDDVYDLRVLLPVTDNDLVGLV